MSEHLHQEIVNLGYSPRPLQSRLHVSMRRFNVVVCHRRFGKTVWAINQCADKALRNELVNPQYAYLAPFYGQAKRVAWDYFKMFVGNIPGAQINEAELRIDVPRADRGDRVRFILLGADNPMALKGMYLDGVILDEFGEMNPSAWNEAVRPTLSDRKGWAIFIGTPKGENHFRQMWDFAKDPANPDSKNWFRAIFRASQTGIIDSEELAAARAMIGEEIFNQEYECSWTAALVGAYYGKLMEDSERAERITDVPYDPQVPVTTSWDIGISDTTAIWFFQHMGPRVHVIDYFEESGMGLPEIAQALKQKGYLYARHILPHDAQVRDWSTGKSRIQTMQSLGVSPRTVLAKLAPADRINAARLLIPKVYFDDAKCRRGIKALKNYQREWDSQMQIFKSNPRHDWASHGADAFGYGALGLRPEHNPDERRLAKKAKSDYDVFTHRGR